MSALISEYAMSGVEDMPVDSTTTAGAAAAAVVASGVHLGDLQPTPSQQQMPPGLAIFSAEPAPIPLIEQLMGMLVAQGRQVQALVEAMSISKKETSINTKFDETNFRRLNGTSNNRDDWKEWSHHFGSAVRECDAIVAGNFWTSEDQETNLMKIPSLDLCTHSYRRRCTNV